MGQSSLDTLNIKMMRLGKVMYDGGDLRNHRTRHQTVGRQRKTWWNCVKRRYGKFWPVS